MSSEYSHNALSDFYIILHISFLLSEIDDMYAIKSCDITYTTSICLQ